MYTLLETKAVEDTMLADYTEHCYAEQVLVHGRCAITCNPATVSQLIRGYQFEPVGDFPTQTEAESARERYLATGTIDIFDPSQVKEEEIKVIPDNPIPSVNEPLSALPSKPRFKLQKTMQAESNKDGAMQVPWFGSNLKIVREEKGSKDGA